MSGGLLFAANWKMHLAPDDARAYAREVSAPAYAAHGLGRCGSFPPP